MVRSGWLKIYLFFSSISCLMVHTVVEMKAKANYGSSFGSIYLCEQNKKCAAQVRNHRKKHLSMLAKKRKAVWAPPPPKASSQPDVSGQKHPSSTKNAMTPPKKKQWLEPQTTPKAQAICRSKTRLYHLWRWVLQFQLMPSYKNPSKVWSSTPGMRTKWLKLSWCFIQQINPLGLVKRSPFISV